MTNESENESEENKIGGKMFLSPFECLINKRKVDLPVDLIFENLFSFKFIV